MNARYVPTAFRRSVFVALLIVVSACSGEAGPIEVEFAGSECVAELPGSASAGNQTFVLTNRSDRRSLPVYVVRLSDGHSYEEFAARQRAEGAYFVLPDWAEYSLRDPSVADPTDDVQRRFAFDLDPGVHAVYLWAARPSAIWLCGPLTVTPDDR